MTKTKPSNKDRLMTVNEVAEYLHVGRSTVYSMMKKKRLEFVTVCGLTRFRPRAVEKLIEE